MKIVKIENFAERYLEMKNEMFLSDIEIAEEFEISESTLFNLKKANNLDGLKRPTTNKSGLTEEQLREGERNGLERRTMLKRVRDYHWSIQDAITKPKGYRRDMMIR
jgi:hypothetical protein